MSWAAIPMDLILDPKVPRAAERVCGYLSWRQGLHQKTWPSVATIAADLGISERSAQRAIALLIQKGHVRRTKPKHQGRGVVFEYTVCLEKGDTHDTLSSEKGDIQRQKRVTSTSKTRGGIRMNYKRELHTGAEGFDGFWTAYPRKVAKAAARKAWERLRPGGELVSRILAALELHKETEQWQKDTGRFIPYPATWLNGRRWEDEVSGDSKAPPSLDDPAAWGCDEAEATGLLKGVAHG